ncbi:alpha-mannosidase [Bombiscardovia nodaiensis]|uniref:Alpha-mannosidase n=1 Tax=Bombiscardovia nodaiensis TaxID=2932181 RepID=A0ABN6SEB7_9BIFI|nr:alpha-mannosidase [Bombiscardovia nodaiensis]
MQLKVERELDKCERVMRQRVKPMIDRPVGTTRIRAYKIAGEPISSGEFFAQLAAGKVNLQPIKIGDTWGTTWGTTWFEVSGQIEVGYIHAAPLELVVDLGWHPDAPGSHFEAMAYRSDGSEIKAVNPRNQWVSLDGTDQNGRPINQEASVIRPDGTFTLFLEAACNPMILGVPAFVKTDLGEGTTGNADEPNVLKRMDVCYFDYEVWNYYMDLEVVQELIRECNDQQPRYWQLGKALQRSMNIFDERDFSTLAPARQALAAVLSVPAAPSSLEHAVVGHAHIDSAWLWPKRETRRKVARTVSNMLALMDRDPDFIYAMSSAQQYAWLEEDHPQLFKRMLERVKEGRFVPVGGMWVESDGMLPAGESLTRQLIYGKRWFRQHLGVDTDGVWEPDSFGYTGQFPQIARKAGMNWFLSQKISWNDTTKFPHHTFDWQGIDGTSIFTHFPPMDTYSSSMTARELNHSQENFQDKDISDRAIVLCGYGDGGGGTTREMLGRYDRLRNVEGSAKVRFEKPGDFYREASEQIRRNAGSEMPVWKGELYLELHRKTLTSQQDMKKGCRQEEAMLRTVEYLCTYASVLNPQYAYPRTDLDEIWKTLLLNQFHDILPGSAIAWVHRLAREDYQRDLARLQELGTQASQAIAQAQPDLSLLEHAQILPIDCEGQDWHVRQVGKNDGTQGIQVISRDGGYDIDNGLMYVHVAADGEVHSLIDQRSGRDLIPQGSSMGGYELMKDEPYMWDAWDLERDALLTAQKIDDPVHIESLSNGVTVFRQHGQTTIATDITLTPGSRQLDFNARIDWQQDEQLLKVDLPVAIQARYAQFECQYGFIDRPIQKNNAAEEAQFESCTHRYVRVRDDGLAVGVVNASTYGGDTTPIYYDTAKGQEAGTMIRLTLLSAPFYPDPHTDRGKHTFAWSIVPSEDQNDILRAAYQLNAPVMDTAIPQVEPLLTLQAVRGRAVIDWVKLADDGSGDLIVRIYDPDSAPAQAKLEPNMLLTNARVKETSSMEDSPLPEGLRRALVLEGDENDSVAAQDALIDLAPFQFTTLRLSKNKA